jgi:predicted AAA+ superfamily ATPase
MYVRNKIIEPDTSCFLFGPRGTGKTFWLRHTFPQAVYVDLLESRTATELLADPQRLAARIPAPLARGSVAAPAAGTNPQRLAAGKPATGGNLVIIDEIQRVPELLNEVHRLIETAGVRFLLTGSSPRKLRRGGANLLAGRALTDQFFPLTAVELGADFDLTKALRCGMLPTLYDPTKSVDAERYLASYVESYLREEVVAEGLTRTAGAFARFLEAASFSQGQILNVSEVARECAVHRKVVESYFDILDDLLLGIRLPPFVKRAKRMLVAHPKFYFFDTGVYRAARPAGPLDDQGAIAGSALETLVLQELRATCHNLRLGYDIHYWRTTGGAEVDFVLYGKRGLVAIEVKGKTRLTGHDLRGLRMFLADYPMAKAYILYGGDHRLSLDGITALPIVDALRNLPEFL